MCQDLQTNIDVDIELRRPLYDTLAIVRIAYHDVYDRLVARARFKAKRQ